MLRSWLRGGMRYRQVALAQVSAHGAALAPLDGVPACARCGIGICFAIALSNITPS